MAAFLSSHLPLVGFVEGLLEHCSAIAVMEAVLPAVPGLWQSEIRLGPVIVAAGVLAAFGWIAATMYRRRRMDAQRIDRLERDIRAIRRGLTPSSRAGSSRRHSGSGKPPGSSTT